MSRQHEVCPSKSQPTKRLSRITKEKTEGSENTYFGPVCLSDSLPLWNPLCFQLVSLRSGGGPELCQLRVLMARTLRHLLRQLSYARCHRFHPIVILETRLFLVQPDGPVSPSSFVAGAGAGKAPAGVVGSQGDPSRRPRSAFSWIASPGHWSGGWGSVSSCVPCAQQGPTTLVAPRPLL